MPITKSALKALRQEKKRAGFNKPVRSHMKTAIDAVQKGKDEKKLPEAFSAIDKAVKQHLVHKNKAARLKSALAKMFAK